MRVGEEGPGRVRGRRRGDCGNAQSPDVRCVLRCVLRCAPMPTTPAPCAGRPAANVAALLRGQPVWGRPEVAPFVDGPFEQIPAAAPSVVNAKELGLPTL